MMKAARTSETLVDFYQTTRRYNPEDSHLLNRNLEGGYCGVFEKTIPAFGLGVK
jgi:hypothetical protein